jgi:hypothetical protein
MPATSEQSASARLLVAAEHSTDDSEREVALRVRAGDRASWLDPDRRSAQSVSAMQSPRRSRMCTQKKRNFSIPAPVFEGSNRFVSRSHFWIQTAPIL